MESTTTEAEVQGIKLRGTPAQIAEVIKLAGLVHEQIRAVPVIPEMDPWKRTLWPRIPGTGDYGGPTCIPTGVTSANTKN